MSDNNYSIDFIIPIYLLVSMCYWNSAEWNSRINSRRTETKYSCAGNLLHTTFDNDNVRERVLHSHRTININLLFSSNERETDERMRARCGGETTADTLKIQPHEHTHLHGVLCWCAPSLIKAN